MELLNRLGSCAKERVDEIEKIDKEIDYTRFVYVHSNGKVFGFNIFRKLGNFTKTIYFDDILLKQAVDKKDEMKYLLRNLGGYKPKIPQKTESQKEVLKNTH